MLFYDILTGAAWQYIYPANQRPWLYGSTLCYTRALWQSNPFMDVAIGEDNRFVWSSYPKQLAVLSDATFYVGIIHPHNSSPKHTSGAYWQPYSAAKIQQLMGDDWNFYSEVRRGS